MSRSYTKGKPISMDPRFIPTGGVDDEVYGTILHRVLDSEQRDRSLAIDILNESIHAGRTDYANNRSRRSLCRATMHTVE